MSTVSTSVTSAATIILTDYYKPLVKNASERRQVYVLRLSSVLVGIIGIFVAIAMLSVESIIDAWWKLSSIFSGGMLGLFLLGIMPRRIHRWAALAGCVAGIAVIAWISLAGLYDLPGIHLHEYLAIVLGTTTIFVVGFLLTLLVKRH
jgi:SSS family solute:Na+ symporter